MRTLGIDVGTATTGWGVTETAEGALNGIKLIAYGVIQTSPKEAMPHRLDTIYRELSELVDTYKPDHAAVESLFYANNQKTVMTVSQARGVILLALAQKGLPIAEFTPLQVKMGVTGYGRAEKLQVQKMVQLILGMSQLPKPDDAADAVAISICHLNSVKPLKQVANK